MLKNRLTKSFFIALALHLSVFLVAAIVIKNCHKTSPEPNYVEVSLLDDINYGNSGENGGSSENNKKILEEKRNRQKVEAVSTIIGDAFVTIYKLTFN